jgi:hypothetical protein
MRNEYLLALFGTCVGVIGLCSFPSLSAVAARLTKPDVKQETYEDADGKATPESMKAFSAKVPKTIILLLAATGLPISIALLLLTLHDLAITLESLVLIVAAWVRLCYVTVPEEFTRANFSRRVRCCSKP